MRWRAPISPSSSIPTIPMGGGTIAQALLALSPRVGRLVVDESFADAVPGLSLAAEAGRPGLLILRSFGKFYGLAGLRLGFALGQRGGRRRACRRWLGPGRSRARRSRSDGARCSTATGPMRRSRAWHAKSLRLDALAQSAGWTLVGGTPLFRLYETGDARGCAGAARATQRSGRAFSRTGRAGCGWVCPADEAEWARLAAALAR